MVPIVPDGALMETESILMNRKNEMLYYQFVAPRARAVLKLDI